MKVSKAPYKVVTRNIARERAVYDRQHYRLIGRMWASYNTCEQAPILSFWEWLNSCLQQVYLPFGKFGMDTWFVRTVNAAVWHASTNVGSNLVSSLQDYFSEPPNLEDVREWFESRVPRVIDLVAHECVPACNRKTDYVFLGGLVKVCERKPLPDDVADTFYIVMSWWCGEEGRYFLERYKEAFYRLNKFQNLGQKNQQFRLAKLKQGGL